jgi:hypothetical protein
VDDREDAPIDFRGRLKSRNPAFVRGGAGVEIKDWLGNNNLAVSTSKSKQFQRFLEKKREK